MQIRPFPTIAPIESAAGVFARAGRLLRAPRELSVSQWAIEALGYDPDVLPWQAEVMDACGDPGVSEVDLMGPAQCGKTEIGLAWWGYSVAQDPADFLICQPDKAMMQDFVVRRIDPLLERNPILGDQLLAKVGADNTFLKQFRGMLSTHIWPVAAQFRARPVPRGWLDDFDQIPADIEGQGSAHKLLGGRQTTFEGSETTFSSSSPASDSGGGIEARVEEGSNERLWARCPECAEWFAPDLERDLKFNDKGSADDAEASAWVACHANGCEIRADQRRLLLASLAELPRRGFLEPHQRIEGGKVVGERRWKRRRGFRVDGLLAFTTWGKLARLWREAQIAWETRQDESELRTFFQVRAGRNYRSKFAAAKAIGVGELLDRREGWRLGEIPAGVGVRVLTASVDTQSNRWEVKVKAWGDGLESWTIDRFEIAVRGDGVTLVDPATYPEHWLELLDRVVLKRYPVAGHPDVTVPILTTAIDTGGEAGVSENAVKFWDAARRLGVHPDRITLIKGGNSPDGPLMPPASYLGRKRGGGINRRGARLFVPNVNKLKSIVDARLRRSEPGPGYIHWPGDYAERHFDELTAEERRGGRWVKLRARNEDLDLEVYAYAALLRPPFMGLARSDFRWVPKDFRVPVLGAAPGGEPEAPAAVPSRPPAQPESASAATEVESAGPGVKRGAARRVTARQGKAGWMGRIR